MNETVNINPLQYLSRSQAYAATGSVGQAAWRDRQRMNMASLNKRAGTIKSDNQVEREQKRSELIDLLMKNPN